jgi:hypothetical protein
LRALCRRHGILCADGDAAAATAGAIPRTVISLLAVFFMQYVVQL